MSADDMASVAIVVVLVAACLFILYIQSSGNH